MRNLLLIIIIAQFAVAASGVVTENNLSLREKFTIDSFMGYRFGDSVTNYCEKSSRCLGSPLEYAIELKKPFRLFEKGCIGTANTGMENDRIVCVRLWTKEDRNISRASYCNEINIIAKMMEKKYGVVFDSNMHIPARYFKNSHIEISIRNDHYAMSIMVKNLDVERIEKSKAENERKRINLSDTEGADML